MPTAALTDEEAFPEASGSQSDRKTSISINTLDILSVNQLLESVRQCPHLYMNGIIYIHFSNIFLGDGSISIMKLCIWTGERPVMVFFFFSFIFPPNIWSFEIKLIY